MEQLEATDITKIMTDALRQAVDNHAVEVQKHNREIERVKRQRTIILKRLKKKKRSKGGHIFLEVLNRKEVLIIQVRAKDQLALDCAMKALEIMQDYSYDAESMLRLGLGRFATGGMVGGGNWST